jgi:hypothetical protein
MGRVRGKKPSPAMIVSIAALVFAIAGTSVASVATISVLNKKEKKQTRRIARNEIDKAAPGLSVASAANAANATNAQTAASAQNANIANTVPNGSIGAEKLASSIPAAGVTSSGPQTIANITGEALTFDTERYDTANMHSTGILADTARLVAPVTGIYEISAAILWEDNGVGARGLFLSKNDTTTLAQERVPAVSTAQGQAISRVTLLQAGDFVKVEVTQTSGGDLDVLKSVERSPEFSLTWLAPGP